MLGDICAAKWVLWSLDPGSRKMYFSLEMDFPDDAPSKPYKTPILVLLLDLSEIFTALFQCNGNKELCSDSKISI